jgi:DNA-binding transcriptional regulator YiaG
MAYPFIEPGKEQQMTNGKNEADINVPELIQKLLSDENMAPAQLATALNVSETTVHRWLKGESEPSGTAAAILWTLIGLGGIAIGAAAPLLGPAAGVLGGTALGARLLRTASVGMGAISSGIGIYKLLKKRLDEAGVDDVETLVEAIKKKEEQEQKVKALRERLEEEEKKLRELEEITGKKV